MSKRLSLLSVSASALLGFALLGAGSASAADQIVVGLITKTNINPFFVKMKEGADAEAKELGMTLQSFAGKYDGDNESQVAAIESLISAGAKGFALVPNDSSAIVPTVKKARDAGMLVIVLDTPLDPIDAADATFATDNFKAGELIGQWAKATMGDKAKSAKIAFLDGDINQPTVDYLRDHGFMKGFGIEYKNLKHYGDETDPRVVGHQVTQGSEEGGQKAMETLLQKDSDINLMYSINEPAAAGGWQALKAAGKDDGSVLVVSVDGGCPGVKNVKAGIIGATSQQYPLKMASMAMKAIADFAKTGKKPEKTPGLDFFDTGATLVTDKPVPGVPSINTTEGLKLCWG